MLSNDDWRALLMGCSPILPSIAVETYFQRFNSASWPVRVQCSDGHEYVLKGPQDRDPSQARTAFNEHVIARLGIELGAPIPAIEVVRLDPELWVAEPGLLHFRPGPLHASRFQANCTDREGLRYYDRTENRARFAALAVLYTWVQAFDHQVIYETAAPYRVWSVDHGHFFTGNPAWTIEALRRAPAAGHLDSFFQAAGLIHGELDPAFRQLDSIRPNQIATVVAAPPVAWDVTMDERISLCMFLDERRTQVLSLRGAP